MERYNKAVKANQFELTSLPDAASKVFLQTVLEDMVHPQPKRPLQCVTVKMPLPDYLRMKRAAKNGTSPTPMSSTSAPSGSFRSLRRRPDKWPKCSNSIAPRKKTRKRNAPFD